MAELHCLLGDSGCGFIAKEPHLKELPPQQETERVWSELPSEMLHLIFKKLSDLPELVRFRAVCQRWRSAASLSGMPLQLPWFVKERWDFLNYSACFYSMHSGRTFKIKLPQSYRRELKGSAHRYLLSFDRMQSSLSLLDPLTRKEIPLPYIRLARCELICIRSDPSGADDFVAICGVLEGSGRCILASCRVGDSYWLTLKRSLILRCCPTYYKGMFYVHDQITRITDVINPNTGGVVHLIPPQEYTTAKPMYPFWCFNFFVESCGDLLGISSFYRDVPDYNPNNCCFQIHRLDYRNGDPRWVEMKSIGDRFLFLHGSSGVSYKAGDFPGFKGDSIYFLGSMIQRTYSDKSSCLLMFDIKRGTAKKMDCPDDVETWFLPGLH